MIRDPATGLAVALEAEGRGSLLVFEASGSSTGRIEAPRGFRLSHLVEEAGGLLVVGQGDTAIDGWPDWHFEIDVANLRLVRAGPAY